MSPNLQLDAISKACQKKTTNISAWSLLNTTESLTGTGSVVRWDRNRAFGQHLRWVCCLKKKKKRERRMMENLWCWLAVIWVVYPYKMEQWEDNQPFNMVTSVSWPKLQWAREEQIHKKGLKTLDDLERFCTGVWSLIRCSVSHHSPISSSI